MRTVIVAATVFFAVAGCRRDSTARIDAAAAIPGRVTVADASHPTVAAYCPPDSVFAISSPREFIAAIWRDIEPRAAGDGFARLSETEQTVASVEQLDREVRRGGFSEYFAMPLGDHALDALAALRRIGAPETASIVERGVAIFGPGGPPRESATRQSRIAALGDGTRRFWAALDGVYLRGPDDLDALLSAYVRAQGLGHCSSLAR